MDSAMSQPTRDAMEPDRVREIEARHRQVSSGPGAFCCECLGDWPCDTRRLLDEHARLGKAQRQGSPDLERAVEEAMNELVEEGFGSGRCVGQGERDDNERAIEEAKSVIRAALAARPATRKSDE